MKVNTHSASYGASLLTLVNIASQIIAFFYRVALVSFIGAEVMGLYQLVLPVYSVVMAITVTGLTVAVSRLSASYAAVGQTNRLPQLIKTSLRIFYTLFLAVAAVVALFSDAISVHLLGDARTRMGLLALLPCIFFTGIENVHKNYFYGMKNVHPPALSEMLEQIVRSGAVLLIVSSFPAAGAERKVALIVCGLVVCEIVSSTLLTFLYRRDMAKKRITAHYTEKLEMRRSISIIALPVALSSLALHLIGSANSVIIPQRLEVSGLPPAEALSLYGVVFGMVLPLLALPMACVGALSLVMLPRLSEQAARGEIIKIKAAVRKTLRAVAFIMVPLLGLLAVFGGSIMELLFHSTLDNVSMALLCLAFLLSAFQSVTGGVLNAVGEQKKNAANLIAAGIIQLIITWIAVARPELRVTGAILAMLISSATCLALNWADVRFYTAKR